VTRGHESQTKTQKSSGSIRFCWQIHSRLAVWLSSGCLSGCLASLAVWLSGKSTPTITHPSSSYLAWYCTRTHLYTSYLVIIYTNTNSREKFLSNSLILHIFDLYTNHLNHTDHTLYISYTSPPPTC
jgi:hypothetical protein